MTKWQCVECGYFLEGEKPPERCPGCKLPCAYTDVTCYRPECGGPVNPDPTIMGMITQRIGLKAPLRPGIPATPGKDTAKTVEEKVVYAEKIRREALFQGLEDDEVKKVLSIGNQKYYPKGSVLFKQGDDAEICIVESGKLSIRIEEGEEIYTASTDEVLGWSTLILPYMRTASAIAVGPSSVVIINPVKLNDFCEENPGIGYKINRNVGRMLGARMRTSRAMSADQIYG
jgi:rubredoxin